MRQTGQRGLTTPSRDVDDTPPRIGRVLADKLIVATGLTSEPLVPKLEGSAGFGAPLFHVKDFCNQAKSKHDIKNFVVLGTSKSAWDACYAYATTDVQVH